MKLITIENLPKSGTIEDYFVVVMADRRMTKKEKPFLKCFFSDATGEAPGVAWDNVKQLEKVLIPGTIVHIKAEVSLYENKPQLNVKKARVIDANDHIDTNDFKAQTPHDITHLQSQMIELIGKISDPMIKKLVNSFFDNKEFYDKFCKHTAAKRVHHAYAGGLLEHSLSVTQTSLLLAQQYKYLNQDLLIAGGLLHDIGKMEEMGGELTTDYTMYGQLVGHISMGSELVGIAASKITDFPSKLKWQIQHLILSHHGKMEYGSPVLPSTMEAIVLHTADMLDAQLFQVVSAIEELDNKEAEFTKRIFGLDRRMIIQPTEAFSAKDQKQEEIPIEMDELENLEIKTNLQETLL